MNYLIQFIKWCLLISLLYHITFGSNLPFYLNIYLLLFQAIYCYTIDSRGPCYVVGGQKIILQWFRSYLIIVSKESKDSSKAITISTTTRKL